MAHPYRATMDDKPDDASNDAQRRDELLLKLLKTPPQPRPKRERGERDAKGKPKSNPKDY